MQESQPFSLEELREIVKMWKVLCVLLCSLKACLLHFFFSKKEGVFCDITGLLGPWLEDTQTGHNKEAMGLKLTDNDHKIVVSRKGMYLIYSQVS